MVRHGQLRNRVLPLGTLPPADYVPVGITTQGVLFARRSYRNWHPRSNAAARFARPQGMHLGTGPA